jgi:hypothetical protein
METMFGNKYMIPDTNDKLFPAIKLRFKYSVFQYDF